MKKEENKSTLQMEVKEESADEIKKMSFNKRISLVKINTFEGVKDSHLDKIAAKGNTDKGYLSLKNIYNVLNPLLSMFHLDLDISIKKDEAIVTWFDCISDKERQSTYNISQIEGVKTLPSMTNEVATMGACFTYIRRYALTSVLGLQAVDIIENINNSDIKKIEKEKKDKNLTNKEKYIKKINMICFNAGECKKEIAQEILSNHTEYTDKDGQTTGKFSDSKILNKCSEKRLQCIYGSLKKTYPEIAEKVKVIIDN